MGPDHKNSADAALYRAAQLEWDVKRLQEQTEQQQKQIDSLRQQMFDLVRLLQDKPQEDLQALAEAITNNRYEA